jgi:hypothetical protein
VLAGVFVHGSASAQAITPRRDGPTNPNTRNLPELSQPRDETGMDDRHVQELKRSVKVQGALEAGRRGGTTQC